MNLIEGLYYIGYSIKKYNDLKNQKNLPLKVISIGNITVGGTGKTPATITIAEEAKRRGFVPVILTRGYKGKIKGPCFVSKGEGPLMSEEDAGDEPIIMAKKLKGVPIVKGEDRYEAGVFALQNLGDTETWRDGDMESAFACKRESGYWVNNKNEYAQQSIYDSWAVTSPSHLPLPLEGGG